MSNSFNIKDELEICRERLRRAGFAIDRARKDGKEITQEMLDEFESADKAFMKKLFEAEDDGLF